MTADLAGFLLTQLDADETVAQAATPGPWGIASDGEPFAPDGDHDVPVVDAAGDPISHSPDDGVRGGHERADAAHIALHDPAFELARIAALRVVVEMHAGEWRDVDDASDAYLACIECDRFGWPCPTLLALAQPYRGRPGWRDEWRTG